MPRYYITWAVGFLASLYTAYLLTPDIASPELESQLKSCQWITLRKWIANVILHAQY